MYDTMKEYVTDEILCGRVWGCFKFRNDRLKRTLLQTFTDKESAEQYAENQRKILAHSHIDDRDLHYIGVAEIVEAVDDYKIDINKVKQEYRENRWRY